MGGLARLLEAVPKYASLLRSQYWRPEELAAYRHQLLEKTLRAASEVPFYAQRLGAAPRADDLSQFPILQRAEVSALHQSVRDLHPGDAPFVEERSSGTSGVAVKLLFDASHQRSRNAARIRYLRMNGWNPLRRSVWFVGATLLANRNPDYQGVGELIRWFSSSLGVKFLSSWMPFEQQVQELKRLQPVSLYAFPSGIEGILRTLEETGERLPSLKVVMCGGETVDQSLRERVHRQLGLALRDNYGSTEAFVAFQCPTGSYHINAEHVMIEIVDAAGLPVAPGQMGKVLVTTLQNYLMPLLRYEIGDYAIAATGGCACGRTLPRLDRILGRQVNLFRKPDGALTSGWQAVGMLRTFPEVKIFQAVQKSLEQIRVRYVADRPLSPESETLIAQKFHADVGAQAKVDFERVAEIERSTSGKFMVTLSELT